MDDDTRSMLAAVVRSIELEGQADGWRLSDLFNATTAYADPELATSGVDHRFWPDLRGIPTSRHPVDVIIAACAAENYLFHHRSTERDRLAVQRLQKGLSHIALGGYPYYSSRAADHIAILARWSDDFPLRYLRGLPTGRRLCRALIKAIDTWIAPPHIPDDSENENGAATAFNRMFRHICEALPNAFATPLMSTDSGASLLQLARRIVLYYSADNQKEVGAVIRILKRLEAVALGLDGTTDILLRREALWYLIEMRGELYRHAEAKVRPLPLLLSDLKAQAGYPQFAELVAAAERLPNQVSVPTHNAASLRDRRYENLLGRDVLGEEPNALFAEQLDKHLPLGTSLPSTAWRSLTRQIALPTKDLLREALSTPASGRARSVAEALRAAGGSVRYATVSVLEDMLQDSAIRTVTALAKRATWIIGFLADAATPTVLGTLTAIYHDPKADPDLAADAAWAVGDVLSGGADQRSGATAALDSLKSWLAEFANRAATNAAAIQLGDLNVARAACHALAIQHASVNAEALDNLLHRFRSMAPSNPALRDQATRIVQLLEWGLNILDNPPALALSRTRSS